MPTRVCAECATSFDVPYPSDARRFCSRSCAALDGSRRRPQNQKRPPTVVQQRCVCGTDYTVELEVPSDRARAYCSTTCALAHRRAGTGRPPTRTGFVNHEGYRMVYLAPDDPLRPGRRTSYVAEHRVVMGRLIGRPLDRSENVHHKNGDRLDNRPKNLELWVTPPRPGQRVKDLLEWAAEIQRRYADLPPEVVG